LWIIRLDKGLVYVKIYIELGIITLILSLLSSVREFKMKQRSSLFARDFEAILDEYNIKQK